MSDQVIVISQEILFIHVAGERMTAIPETGTIASMEKGSPDAAVIGAMFRTVSIVFLASDLYTATLNIVPGSDDDAYLQNARRVSRRLGRPLTLNISYKLSKWKSTGCAILQDPTRSFIADGTEVLAYQFGGIFTSNVTSFGNPEPLTAELISAG